MAMLRFLNASRLFWLAILVYGATSFAALLVGRHLFGDAANFLVKIGTNGDVTHFYTNLLHEFQYSRMAAFHLTQGPAVAWLGLGGASLWQVSLIYGLTLWGLKIASLALSYRFLASADKALFVFPLLTLVAGSINADLYIVSESHVMVSLFWPTLIAMTTARDPTPGRCAFVLCSSLLMLCTYETALFFGPILGFTALRAGLASHGRCRAMYSMYFAAAALFVLGALFALDAVVNARDLINRTSFFSSIWAILITGVPDLSRIPIGPMFSFAVIALVGLVMIGQGMSRDPGPRAVTAALGLAIAGGLAIIVQAIFADATLQIGTTAIRSRILNLVAPLAFALTYLAALEMRHRRSGPGQAAALGTGQFQLLAGVAAVALLAQAAYQNILTARWMEATAAISTAVARKPGGPIAFPELLEGLEPRKAGRITALAGDWWIQPLSVLLAPDKQVRSIVIFGPGNPEVFRPFDPWIPERIPTMEKLGWSTAEYITALRNSRQLAPGTSIDFRQGGNGWRFAKHGLSQPETWGTWSVGSEVRIELPGPMPPGDLSFSLEVRPFLPRPESKLTVTALVGGEAVATWRFAQGWVDQKMDLRIPARLVPDDDALTLTFRIEGAQSPASLGMSADSRLLGIGLVTMRLAPAS